jgi:hypothetical protein
MMEKRRKFRSDATSTWANALLTDQSWGTRARRKRPSENRFVMDVSCRIFVRPIEIKNKVKAAPQTRPTYPQAHARDMANRSGRPLKYETKATSLTARPDRRRAIIVSNCFFVDGWPEVWDLLLAFSTFA